MPGLAIFLLVLWVILLGYTTIVVVTDGVNLFPIFFGDIQLMGWSGQFNLDFLMLLILSACWTVWRNGYTMKGWFLALLAFCGGAGFLLPYLAYLITKYSGDMDKVILGPYSKSNA